MLRDLYEKEARTGGVGKTMDETSAGFGRNMMEMREFVKAQRTYNVSLLSFRHAVKGNAHRRLRRAVPSLTYVMFCSVGAITEVQPATRHVT